MVEKRIQLSQKKKKKRQKDVNSIAMAAHHLSSTYSREGGIGTHRFWGVYWPSVTIQPEHWSSLKVDDSVTSNVMLKEQKQQLGRAQACRAGTKCPSRTTPQGQVGEQIPQWIPMWTDDS